MVEAEPPQTQPDPEPTEAPRVYSTDVLLFNGTGVSTSDWQTTEHIIRSAGLSYQLANSAQLNAMTLNEISDFGVIVVPGGSGGTITSNLSTATRLRVRAAASSLVTKRANPRSLKHGQARATL